MSTLHITDERLSSLFQNTEDLIDKLVEILAENYNERPLLIGNNITKKFNEREAFYTIVDSEFENVFLSLIYRNTEGNRTEIRLKTIHDDYPTELRIKINSDVTDKLPEKMMDDLFERLHDFENNYF